jgi:hypothetical protein
MNRVIHVYEIWCRLPRHRKIKVYIIVGLLIATGVQLYWGPYGHLASLAVNAFWLLEGDNS